MTTETCNLSSLAVLERLSRALTVLLDLYVDEFEESDLANIIFKEMPLEWNTAAARNSGADWADLLFDFANECADEGREIAKESGIDDPRARHQFAVETVARDLAWDLGLLPEERKAAA